jgi:hypothetical protein
MCLHAPIAPTHHHDLTSNQSHNPMLCINARLRLHPPPYIAA